MPKVRQTKEWTKSDALAEVTAADPCDFVLETSPPDFVEKISQLLGSSSVVQTGRDGAAANPADTDSDSADSLFITQKPVPEAVRSGRRRPHSASSGPTSPSFLEESEDGSSHSASRQESRRKKSKKKVKFKLPKYSFPFLKDKTLKLTSTVLPEPQNIRLHYSSMGGFFDCMRKLQQSYQTGEDLETNLPTLDMNGECILPISEEEEEEPLEDADMKVVAKKHFVVPSKVKRSQPWYSEKKRDGEVKQQKTSCINAAGKMSRGWKKTLHKIPTKSPSLRTAPSPNLENSDDEDTSYRILGEGAASDKQQKGERSVPAQTETPKTNRSLNREKKDNSEQKEKEDEPCDSSAPLCEQSPNESIQEGREASITEPHADALNREGLSQAGQQDSKSKGQRFFQSGTNNIIIGSETRGKKKNDKEDNESAEEDGSQSQEVPEVQHAAPSMNEEITELEERPHLPQPINEPELRDKRVMEESDISDSQQKKKKRQNESSAEDVRQEVHEHFDSDVRINEDSVHLGSSNRGKKKKKKKNDKEDTERVEEEKSQSQEELEVQHAAASVNEGITEEEEMPGLSQSASELEFSEKPVMESGIPNLQQKKKKKKKSKNESSAEDIREEVHERFESDVRIGEDSVDLASFNRSKKKKKKNNKEENQSVEEEMSQSQEELEVQHAAASVNERITKVVETPRLSQIASELKLSGKTGMEESDISDSKQKKKKKKKKQNESSADDVRQEVHEHFDSDVRISEDSVHLGSSNRGKKKKKKKNDKEATESVEEEKSQSQEEQEVQHAAASVNEGITEEEEEETAGLSQSATQLESSEKPVMESGIPNLQQKKKKKKKRKNESSAENKKPEKKKKKTESNDDEEDVEQFKCNTAPESLHEDVEILPEKITAARCDVSASDSVAAGKPGISTGGESTEMTGCLEESNERVRKKKKKKRKMSAAQESVEKDEELDVEELNETCEEALADTGVRQKKKRKRNETGSGSAADAGFSDEAVVVKKKLKKKDGRGSSSWT
ncbi:phoenix [Archocentrus centrarchus]|uniref:phoenix n=1 Tax=Archocentrus centrarchus TaxID=63155 RepID=UPI0011E9FC69|nr:ABC transporter F family member 4-like [Archocentrus centrarchus]